MHKLLVALAASGSLALVALSTQAQVLAPPPAVVVPSPAQARPAEIVPAHLPADGSIVARRPGQATAFDFVGDDDLDRLLPPGIRPDAWLVTNATGRWWIWDDGSVLPADRRAEAYRTLGAGPR